MVGDQRLLVDRFAIATGGHNSGDDPEVIPEINFANGKNVTVRGGRVKSRPRFRKVMDLPPGKFQGAHYFRDNRKLIVVCEGLIYETDPDIGEFAEIRPYGSSGLNPLQTDPTRPRVWFENVGGGHLVIQDGLSTPRIYSGGYARYAESDEVPVGTIMRFANGRLHVASTGSRRILKVGDIFQPGDPGTALKFTETTYLTGGGGFRFPSEITALMELPVLDTATGQGSMIVGTATDIFSLHTEVTDRDSWSTLSGFQQLLLPGIGMAGDRGISRANTDVFFRSSLGLRSLRLATTDLSTPGFGGLQQEIPERFPSWRREDVSMVTFRDRLILLTDPFQYQGSSVFSGMVVVNFDSLNRIGQKSPPVFDGFWDGLNIRELVEADGRCYAVVMVPGGNELWELLRDGDDRGNENPTQYIDTRAMNAGDPGGLKALHRLDLWMSEVDSDLEVKISFKTDDAPGFTPWETVNIAHQSSTGYNPGPKRKHVSRLTLATPPEGENVGYNFQFRIAWTGRARLDLVQVHMRPMTESRYVDNEPTVLGVDNSEYDQTHQSWKTFKTIYE
jgi:hypothetical protein